MLISGRRGAMSDTKMESLQVKFAAKALEYQIAEKYWRQKSFEVAATLGLLPIIAGEFHQTAPTWEQGK